MQVCHVFISVLWLFQCLYEAQLMVFTRCKWNSGEAEEEGRGWLADPSDHLVCI